MSPTGYSKNAIPQELPIVSLSVFTVSSSFLLESVLTSLSFMLDVDEL